jgi:hypothetical protein
MAYPIDCLIRACGYVGSRQDDAGVVRATLSEVHPMNGWLVLVVC